MQRSRSRRSFPSRPASICRGHEINTPSLLKKQATRVTTKRRRESVVFSGDSFIPTLQRQEHSSASRLTTPYSLFAELLHRHSPSNVHSSASRSRARRPFSTNHSITLGLVYNRRYQPAVFLSPENIQGSPHPLVPLPLAFDIVLVYSTGQQWFHAQRQLAATIHRALSSFVGNVRATRNITYSITHSGGRKMTVVENGVECPWNYCAFVLARGNAGTRERARPGA